MPTNTEEKPSPVVAPSPGLKIAVPVPPLVAAIREMIAVVPRMRGKSKYVGFGPLGFCVFGASDVSYLAGECDEATAWTDADPSRLLALLSAWGKDEAASVAVTVGKHVLEFGTPDGGRFTLPLCASIAGTEVGIDGAWFRPSDDLCAYVRKAAGFCSSDSHRRILSFVAVQVVGGKSCAIATDTHRIYVGRAADPSPASFLVPMSVARFVDGGEFCASGRRAGYRLKSGVASWSIVGDFPKWERLVRDAEEWPLDVDLSGEVVIPAVERALVYARDDAFRVRLTPKDGTIGVSARAKALGEIYVPVAFAAGKAGFEFALNGKYLIHAMRTLGGTPQVRGEASNRPMRFDRGEETVVVMPMALGSSLEETTE